MRRHQPTRRKQPIGVLRTGIQQYEDGSLGPIPGVDGYNPRFGGKPRRTESAGRARFSGPTSGGRPLPRYGPKRRLHNT